MKTAIIVLLAIGLIVALCEAFKYRTALTALITRCVENDYKMPNDKEVENLANRVVTNIINRE